MSVLMGVRVGIGLLHNYEEKRSVEKRGIVTIDAAHVRRRFLWLPTGKTCSSMQQKDKGMEKLSLCLRTYMGST